MDKKAILQKDYVPYINKWGKITNGVGILAGFIPVLYIGIIHGIWPNIGGLTTGAINILSAMAVSYFMQPLQFYPILGIAGTYMSNLSGQINNMRVPCSIAAENAIGVDAGTPEAEIVANIASAVSTLINIVILAIGTFAGAAALSRLPASFSSALSYCLPALLGGSLMMVSWNRKNYLPIAFAVSVIVRVIITRFFPGLKSILNMLVIIFTALTAAFLYYKTNYFGNKK